MTDEEKKAIKKVKYICDKWYDENLEIDVKWLESLLSLCEKQSKEIEALKLIHESYKEMIEENNYISKDKIKAIIEELQEDIKYSANPLSIDNSKFGIKVLQSLLEKE